MKLEKEEIHERLRECQEEQRRYYNCGASDLTTLHNGQRVTIQNQ